MGLKLTTPRSRVTCSINGASQVLPWLSLKNRVPKPSYFQTCTLSDHSGMREKSHSTSCCKVNLLWYIKSLFPILLTCIIITHILSHVTLQYLPLQKEEYISHLTDVGLLSMWFALGNEMLANMMYSEALNVLVQFGIPHVLLSLPREENVPSRC